jgi:glycosyltransferase involved in cell wall biosynthesis
MNEISRPVRDPLAEISPPDDDARGEAAIRRSGLFDAAWYLARNADVARQSLDPLRHYLDQGWREGRRPNPYFDPEFYLARCPEVARAGIDPLLHYIWAGEAQGLPPSEIFEPGWYAAQHLMPPGQSPLAHYLANRFTARLSPIAAFDVAFYIERNIDLAHAKIDPFEHYLHYGYREGRDPSAEFDTKFYLHRYLDGALDENPLLHWRRCRHILTLRTRPAPDEEGVFEAARRNARPGPDFEEAQPLPRSAVREAKLLAYYLPQFHRVAENDRWWGAGFTEWTSIARGMPRFEGHYQPRIPRDLGCYDLANPETMRRQIELARNAGIFGFVHYFYWFNRRRLLETPTEAMLADPSLDFPFCLMWANENWSRRWDGSEQEVLIRQNYREEDEPELLAAFARHFADPRYIRLGGRPLLMLYRAGIVPDCAAMLARWRLEFRVRFDEDPIVLMAQSFDDRHPAEFGCDGAIEFPPHKLTKAIRPINQRLRRFDATMRGQIYSYDDLAAASLAEPAPDYPLVRCAVPSWDNDARREGAGMVLAGSTPAKYQAWLAQLVADSDARRVFGERIVAINAWNEWAEGAYLEPDLHYGAAYLNATARAVARPQASRQRERVLLVGHDAFPAGAQMLLLNIGRQLMATHGVEVEFLLLGDGRLAPDYSALAPTHIAADRHALDKAIKGLIGRGIAQALVNTSAASRAIPALERAGIGAIQLVHELPRVIAEHGLMAGLRAGVRLARRVIFPAVCVRDAFPLLDRLAPGQIRLLPQGLYSEMRHDPAARMRARQALGVPEEARMVLGAGYGDLRKGIDLFLQAARQAWNRPDGKDLHFCWVGDMAHTLATYLGPEIEAAMATGRGHFPGFQTDMQGYMNAADAFALTSREDPFPSVALEALASGIKVAAFAGAGGISDLLADSTLGRVAPMSDSAAMAEALCELAATQSDEARAAEAAAAQTRFDFAPYVGELLGELRQGAPRITAAVLSHNYARHIEERLASVFAQTYPVEEALLLDDASTDDSVAVAEATAASWRRSLRLDLRGVNSGGVFPQWRRAAELARGDHLWIAEADDAASPDMLARLAGMLERHGDLDLVFCDSRAIGPDGETVFDSYQDYYRQSGLDLLAEDGVFDARAFLETCLSVRNAVLNASAAIFRTEALRAALARCGDELASWRVAGDWRVYVELLAQSSGRVGWLAAPLNRHRRHASSATSKLPAKQMKAEIGRMHKTINDALGPDKARMRAQKKYLGTL